MPEPPKMSWQELKARCRHHYLCSFGLDKCRSSYGWCSEAECPAFDADDPVPVHLLLQPTTEG